MSIRKRILPLPAFIGALSLLAPAVTWAQTATDLVCAGCVQASDIANGTIGPNKLIPGSINATTIANGSIGPNKLIPGSINTTTIANNAIRSNKILDGAVQNADIADGAVTAAKLADGPGSGVDADTLDGMEADAIIAASQGFNPLQVALLRWYEANESGIALSVGNAPLDVAFDGAHIWVTNGPDDTVSKL